jgi:long-chain acyl-CoA synthetase
MNVMENISVTRDPSGWEPTPRLLTDLLDAAVANHPERVAVDFLGRTWRYREIGALVERAARGLQDLGLRKGIALRCACPTRPISWCCILPR